MDEKIKFRDYSKYPAFIMDACKFRDDYDDESDGVFIAMAMELGLWEKLITMAEWEEENTSL